MSRHDVVSAVSAAPLETVPAALYRDGMARLGAAVNIVTSDGPAGRAGFTATAVCSVTDTPATLIVCINQLSSAFHAVTANGVVAVNVLSSSQQPLADRFGGRTPMDERFAGATWQSGATGAPFLVDAAAVFECRITGRAEVGSHHVLFCAVMAVHLSEQSTGLAYFARGYHPLTAR